MPIVLVMIASVLSRHRLLTSLVETIEKSKRTPFADNVSLEF